MFTYDNQALLYELKKILQDNQCKPDEFGLSGSFQKAFVLLPRKTGKATVTLTVEQGLLVNAIRPGLSLDDWTVDRLARVYLLAQADANERETYVKVIENLFLAAEMNELVALYSALPLLAYPESWVKRCAEGIRSNIGSVLEAIMYDNSYPAEQLSQEAWNQLVMKAIFTEKQLDKINGLNTRNNAELARMLLDHARERGAAGRTVTPGLWTLTEPFTDTATTEALKKQYTLS